jgi:Spy/CpxP family protein refolding chaperone
MNAPLRTFLGMLALTIIAAALAGWLGVRYGVHRALPPADLDTMVHQQLDLSSDQDRRIEALEAQYAARRLALQAEMTSANQDLAAAIMQEHAYGPRADQAIGRFHRAMRALQEATIRHVLAMRAVLTPGQAKKFDSLIAKALIADEP